MSSRNADILAVRQSLGRLSSWLHASKRWLVHENLTMQQGWALHHIVETEAIRPGVLAKLIETSPAATTSLLDNLERHGLVARRPDPAERRAIIATPTQEAKRIWPVIEQRLQKSSELTFDSWQKAELQEFRTYIERFLQDAQPPEFA